MNLNLFFITFLMVILIISGVSKFLTIKSFKGTLSEIGFSQQLSNILAYGVPSIELLIALFLVFGSVQYVGLVSICHRQPKLNIFCSLRMNTFYSVKILC
ncbi:MauE/DoxX family redox-associated membrane protein, partial [Lysinibacillus boronitolerans]|uniref:MauE/DoxX family redox-associated membrane protein n=1 Tax=Lysinibacillus boronitolerans TaxID=309788 RepID=UPI0038539686